MSFEDLVDEELAPVPLRKVSDNTTKTVNPLVTNPAYAIQEFVNSKKQVQYTLSMHEFKETKLAGVISKIRRYFVHLSKSIYRNGPESQATDAMMKQGNIWWKKHQDMLLAKPIETIGEIDTNYLEAVSSTNPTALAWVLKISEEIKDIMAKDQDYRKEVAAGSSKSQREYTGIEAWFSENQIKAIHGI